MDILTDIMQKCGNHDAGHVGIYVGNGMLFQEKTQLNCEHYKNGLMCMDGKGWGWNGSQDFSKIN